MENITSISKKAVKFTGLWKYFHTKLIWGMMQEIAVASV